MKQADLDRAVARATRDTISTIKQLGFQLDSPTDRLAADSDGHGPNFIDWDELEAQRAEGIAGRSRHEPAAV